MSRRIILVAVAVIAVLAGFVGWMLGRQIESPAEAAARVAPPPASLISVPVEQRELSSAVITRGTIEFDQTTSIDVTGSETGSTIITRLTKNEGDDLLEGDVVIEVAGRPLFVLEGELPVFRSLTPGLEGPDVLQLEEALERLGLDPGPVDGVYGARTEDAVEEMYRLAGYRAPAVDLGEQATLDGATDRVEAAEDAISQAEGESTTDGLAESELLQLDSFVSQAEASAAGLRNQRASTTQIRDDAVAAVSATEQALATARTRHEIAVRDGVHPDTGTSLTAAEVEEFRATRQAAKEAFDAASFESVEAIATFESEIAILNPEIESADLQVRIARAQRTETIEAASQGTDASFIDDLRDELADAQEDLELLERDIGTRMPASELVFLPSLPRLIQRVNVEVGDFPSGSVMDVSGSELAVVSGVSEADRDLLEVGQVGLLDDSDLEFPVEASIDFIADNAGGPDLSSDRYRVRLVPTGDVPEDLFNQSLRLRIPISSTGGEVLTVPLAALSAAADGSSRVEKLIDADTTELVEVRVGLSSGGFVEVEAVDGVLESGDRVVVGRDEPDEVDEDAEIVETESAEETDDEESEAEESEEG